MSTYKGQTPARRKANNKYLSEKVDSVLFRVPKGQKELIKAAADKHNKTLSQYCADIVMESVRAELDDT